MLEKAYHCCLPNDVPVSSCPTLTTFHRNPVHSFRIQEVQHHQYSCRENFAGKFRLYGSVPLGTKWHSSAQLAHIANPKALNCVGLWSPRLSCQKAASLWCSEKESHGFDKAMHKQEAPFNWSPATGCFIGGHVKLFFKTFRALITKINTFNCGWEWTSNQHGGWSRDMVCLPWQSVACRQQLHFPVERVDSPMWCAL